MCLIEQSKTNTSVAIGNQPGVGPRAGMPSSVSHILVVDDDPGIRESLCSHLQKHGFSVAGVGDAEKARGILGERQIDLVVLDVMLPGEDGLSLCRHMRETGNVPVILVTALSGDADRIVGLEIGADDYICKPFNPRELIARIRAVLRRSAGGRNGGLFSEGLAFGRWTLDVAQCEVRRQDGVIVPLSTGELSLLLAFLRRPEEILSRDELMSLTRGREFLPLERTIDNMISRLRRKIEEDPSQPRLIKTVRGGGYRFVGSVSPC